jgi:peptide/nickel transport system permease protein
MPLLILRRLGNTIPTIVAVVLVIFTLFSVIPGSFTSSGDDGRMLDAQVMERMRKELGLDDPLHQRFGTYVANLAQGDLGTSFRTREPVTKVIAQRLWPSLKLTIAAMGFAILVGVPLGFIAALRPGSLIDMGSMVVAISGLSLPKFWLGLMLMYLFALTLGWLPSFGYGDGGLRHLILPAVALGVSPMALLARTTRAGVLDVLNADFVRTARPRDRPRRAGTSRNALVLVLTTACRRLAVRRWWRSSSRPGPARCWSTWSSSATSRPQGSILVTSLLPPDQHAIDIAWRHRPAHPLRLTADEARPILLIGGGLWPSWSPSPSSHPDRALRSGAANLMNAEIRRPEFGTDGQGAHFRASSTAPRSAHRRHRLADRQHHHRRDAGGTPAIGAAGGTISSTG